MFWEGFTKQASSRMVGVKSIQPLSASGRMVGNKPSSMVSTVAAYKPSPLPTPDTHGASNISKPSLPNSATINTKVKQPKHKKEGVSESVI